MSVFEGQVTPGGGAPYWVSDAPVEGGLGRVPGSHLFITVGGVPMQLDLAAGIYLPAQMVLSDTDGTPVKVGDATNNAARVFSVGGQVSIASSAFDDSAFSAGVNGGFPSLYATGDPAAVENGKLGVPRMSNDRVMFQTGPPRENTVQNFLGLTGASEDPILPAAGPGIYNDLTGIWVYSTNASTRFTVFLRDSTGGSVRFPIAIAAGGGSNNSLTRPFLQTSPDSPWTAQLDVSPAPGIVYVILQAEQRTANS